MQFLSSFKTFLSLTFLGLQRNAIYRMNFLLPYLLKIFQLIGSIAVWSALFKTRSVIHGYTFSQMVAYLIFASCAFLLFYPFHMFSLQELVRKGTLSGYLLRPYSYMLHSAALFFSKKMIHLLFFLAVFSLFSFLTGHEFYFGVREFGVFSLSLTLSVNVHPIDLKALLFQDEWSCFLSIESLDRFS